MSLWDLTPCARSDCGHARHLHRNRDTKQGPVKIHCSRCGCPEYVEPPLPPIARPDFIERAPMFDEDERLGLWYFNLRMTFLGHPEARITVVLGSTQIRRDGSDDVVIERAFGRDIDQNNWMGKMQAAQLLADYEAKA